MQFRITILPGRKLEVSSNKAQEKNPQNASKKHQTKVVTTS